MSGGDNGGSATMVAKEVRRYVNGAVAAYGSTERSVDDWLAHPTALTQLALVVFHGVSLARLSHVRYHMPDDERYPNRRVA